MRIEKVFRHLHREINVARDRWLEQAQLLASGDVKTFEARFGKL